jgi:uncharacterized protein involved in exopolysaccharide biosynthesis
MAQYDVDLREYWQIIRKRKTYIILLVIIVGICSLGFAKFKEPRPLYEAVAAIKIDRSAPKIWIPMPTLLKASRCWQKRDG